MIHAVQLFTGTKGKIFIYAMFSVLVFVISVLIHRPSTVPDKGQNLIETVETRSEPDDDARMEDSDDDEVFVPVPSRSTTANKKKSRVKPVETKSRREDKRRIDDPDRKYDPDRAKKLATLRARVSGFAKKVKKAVFGTHDSGYTDELAEEYQYETDEAKEDEEFEDEEFEDEDEDEEFEDEDEDEDE